MSGLIYAGGVAWLVEAIAGSAVMIALVLLLRAPVRRAFGAPVAYALWALPLLRLLLPPLPQGLRAQVAAPLPAPLADVGQQVTVFIVPAAVDGPATSWLTPGLALALVWGVGAAAFIGWHVLSYARFRQRLLRQATTIDRVDGITIVESAAAAGPLAFGVAHRFVAFPRDFAARYDADERGLALAHELGHHQRGDLVANWFALAMLALHWFNPLAWYAFRAFRADQEMANDARVLARLGRGARHAYACAIVKAAHGGAIAAACHLHTVDDLKGRLRMLGMGGVSRARAWSGLAGVAATGAAALALTASGTQAAERVRASVAKAADATLPDVLPRVLPQIVPPHAAEAKSVRVVVEQDGRRTVYKGKAAEAWIAANPVPAPPVPPVSPTVTAPAAPPAPAGVASVPVPPTPAVPPAPRVMLHGGAMTVNVPEVRSGNCGGAVEQPVVERRVENGRERITICNDRIARTAARAQAASAQAARAHGRAMASAGRSMHAARAAILANPHLSADQRDAALDGLDAEIDRTEDEHDRW
ncbi:M56 family metallopeptidase [Sphingomonas sp. TZW2008]|uniref:M56 family metallopeptidase n=1 Tax=Sphingomonas sp. TZW2008 TaxID=1917973 RepID=UPI002119D0A3|nr:M56 family metallopeptidase [Sphingomonas sp. TZW2008]